MSFSRKRDRWDGLVCRRSGFLLWLAVILLGCACCTVTQCIYISPRTEGTSAAHDGSISCRPATLSLGVTSTLINLFIQALLIPELNRYNGTLIIPEEVLEHVWVGPMTLQHFHLDSLVARTGTPDAQGVVLHIKGLRLKVERTKFTVQYLGLTCHGTFWATLRETGVDAALRLTILPEGRWNATFSKLKFDWGRLEVHHELEGGACNFLQNVVELFTGKLDTFVASKVMAVMDQEGSAKVARGLNDAFANFSIRAITPPVMTADALTVTVDMNPVTLGCPPAAVESTVPDLVPRDIAVRTTPTSINNLLHNAVLAKKLRVEHSLPAYWNTSLFQDVIPDLYLSCPECPLFTLVEANKEPVIRVPDDGEFHVGVEDVILELYVRPNSSQQTVFSSLSSTQKATVLGADPAKAFRSLHISKGRTSREAGKPFAVLALRFSATTGVRNIDAGAENSIDYEVLPITDVDIEVEESNIGYVNTDELVKFITTVYNVFATPLVNGAAPMVLPFFAQRALLEVGSELIQGGLNIGLHNELLRTVTATALVDGNTKHQGWLWRKA
ncbi:hypothetical protein JKF63_01958 [Porcisia hertigi]|uniref:Uncharacterized protein n=1 Tax=Porcisia hertigi TaxID=2761500 RepID=A0A836LBC3_9TRYP|nr:hypothetical protein JKF63_01958 [Porcisia hertigi]